MDFTGTVAVISCVALPILLPCIIIWLIIRPKINKTNKQTEILLAAIEKNSDVDVEAFSKLLNQKDKTIKERLLRRLTWGSVLSCIGIVLVILNFSEDYYGSLEFGAVFLAIGLPIIISYFVGKKSLAKEIEIEEENMRAVNSQTEKQSE